MYLALGRSGRALSWILEFDEDEVNRSHSNVLCPVNERVAIEDVTRFELGLRRLAVGKMVAHRATGDDVSDVGWMRVQLLSLPRLQDRFEDPHSIVLQLDVNGLGIYDGRVLGRSDSAASEYQQSAHG